MTETPAPGRNLRWHYRTATASTRGAAPSQWARSDTHEYFITKTAGVWSVKVVEIETAKTILSVEDVDYDAIRSAADAFYNTETEAATGETPTVQDPIRYVRAAVVIDRQTGIAVPVVMEDWNRVTVQTIGSGWIGDRGYRFPTTPGSDEIIILSDYPVVPETGWTPGCQSETNTSADHMSRRVRRYPASTHRLASER